MRTVARRSVAHELWHSGIPHYLGLCLALFALTCVVGNCGGGCKPYGAGATAAESAYTAELLRCVDDARTLAESRACRQTVDARWGITETSTKDGGR